MQAMELDVAEAACRFGYDHPAGCSSWTATTFSQTDGPHVEKSSNRQDSETDQKTTE